VHDSADLSRLSCVERITGELSIVDTTLQDVTGLESLKAVGGLSIRDNPALVSLRGLDHLSAVDVGLFIMRNESLVELAGLESLETVGESLIVEENPSLRDVAGLSSLVSVVDALNVISGGPLLRFSNNAKLGSLRGLARLKDVAGTLDVCGNPALSELSLGGNMHAQRTAVLYNRTLDETTAQAFASATSPIAKSAANGATFGVGPFFDVCPWPGDGTCDEPDAFQGDVPVSCTEPPCCTIGGPTALCMAQSDAASDCPGPIGPP
jgi:hypothetical protein